MDTHTEYRTATALGIDNDGRLRGRSMDYAYWDTDACEARILYDDITSDPDAPLTALMSRRVTEWEPVDGPIEPHDGLTPVYRAELWGALVPVGVFQRSKVTVSKRTFAAAEAAKDIAAYHGDHGWRVYARLESPITIIDKQGEPLPVNEHMTHIYDLAP